MSWILEKIKKEANTTHKDKVNAKDSTRLLHPLAS